MVFLESLALYNGELLPALLVAETNWDKGFVFQILQSVHYWLFEILFKVMLQVLAFLQVFGLGSY